MPYAKEGIWTNAVFADVAGTRTPFRENQNEISIINETSSSQEVRLKFHEAKGYFSDNYGDAKFLFKKQ